MIWSGSREIPREFVCVFVFYSTARTFPGLAVKVSATRPWTVWGRMGPRGKIYDVIIILFAIGYVPWDGVVDKEWRGGGGGGSI